jgi:hypothetical protein
MPIGIKGSDLSLATPQVQRETMVTWFIANHVKAEGPYFGFAEAAPIRSNGPLNTYPLNEAANVVGFGQGPFFNGGRSPELLTGEFGEFVQKAMIMEVAALFDGLWELIPPEQYREVEKQTPTN